MSTLYIYIVLDKSGKQKKEIYSMVTSDHHYWGSPWNQKELRVQDYRYSQFQEMLHAASVLGLKLRIETLDYLTAYSNTEPTEAVKD